MVVVYVCMCGEGGETSRVKYLSKAILRTQKCLKNSGKMLSFT